MSKKYCFTEQEFYVLAGCLGIRQLYGFKPGELICAGEKELYQLLFKMSAKGFLETAADCFLVIEGVRELFDCLKQAENVITILAVDKTFPVKCIYSGEKTLLVEAGGIQGKYFKCACGSLSEIWEGICEDNVLLEQNIADDLLYDAEPVEIRELEDDGLVRMETFLAEDKEIGKREKLQEYGVHAIWEKRNADDALAEKRMYLIQRPLYDVILIQETEGVKMFRYSKRLLMEIWKEWMEETRNDNGRCLCTGDGQGV